MKNIIKFSITCLSLILLACQTDNEYEEYNRNPKNPSVVPYATLFSSATKSLVDEMVTTNYNTSIYKFLAQYWTQTTYTDETNFNMQNRKIPQNHWYTMYANVLYDLKDAAARAEAGSSINKAAEKAQITVLEVFAWQNMVDTFGNIPYSQALNPAEYPLPVYDDAATIYTDLMARLDAAITALSGSTAGFSSADLIYGGDISKWSKFANSLKLRLAMRLADVNPSVSKTAAEAAIAAGVMTSNADNAAFSYLSAPPNTNPIWVSIVQSGRKDYVACKTFVDVLNGLGDPRVEIFFKDKVGGVIVGGPYGANNTYTKYSHIADNVLAADFEGTILDFVEVSFLQAEAVERGYTLAGTAAQHYENGIRASMAYWGGDTAAQDAYMAKPDVAYATAPGDWAQKIATQFWIGMYNRGFEGWNVWRRFDGKIPLALPEISGNPIPTRYTYPINEQNLNETNRSAAASAIGGDTQTTKIFWDQ
tara:strand:+ start:1616 stop:3049 length:1434 start_codon:yes stop_codon:yes gene_type:complete